MVRLDGCCYKIFRFVQTHRWSDRDWRRRDMNWWTAGWSDSAKEKRQHIYKSLRYLQPLQNPTMALKRAWKSCIRTGCIWTFKHIYIYNIYKSNILIKYSFVSHSLAFYSTVWIWTRKPNWKRTSYSNLTISDSSFAERWASAQLLCQKLASKRIVFISFYFYVIPEIHSLDKTCLPSRLRVYVHIYYIPIMLFPFWMRYLLCIQMTSTLYGIEEMPEL